MYLFFLSREKIETKTFFSIYCNNLTMKDHREDGIQTKRARGKDKAKDRYNRNGGFSTKHLRLKELEREKKSALNTK